VSILDSQVVLYQVPYSAILSYLVEDLVEAEVMAHFDSSFPMGQWVIRR
jgi:hypothetical protein